MLKITYPENGACVAVLTDEQKEYMEMDRSGFTREDFDWLNLKRESEKERSHPRPVTLKWEPAVMGLAQISETEDFVHAFTATGEGEASIYNLKIGTTYYARILSGTDESEVISFMTEDMAPRLIYVDGISNVRDAGGWKTKDGRRVRQGLLYRGSEMNSHVTISPKGIETMLNDLRIKTDLDVRSLRENRMDVLRVNYQQIPCRPYHQFLINIETCNQLFEFLSNVDNYPIYYHCYGGADRTATLAFMLAAVLGVPEKALIDDYEATGLSYWGMRSRNGNLYKQFIEALNRFVGEDICEKAVNYLLFAGVTEETIEKIRNIFLEDISES